MGLLTGLLGSIVGGLGTGLGSAAAGAAAGGVLGAGGRDSRESLEGINQTVNRGQSSFTPAGAAAPLYGNVAGIGQQLGGTPTPYFPGMGYVGPSGPTQQGINLGMGALPYYGQAAQTSAAAAPLMGGLLGQGLGNYNFLSNAADVGQNPYVQDMMSQNARLLNRNFTEGLMPQIRGSSVGVNALGSSRQGIAEGLAARGTQEAISDANERLLLGAYGQGLGAQTSALGQTGSMLNNLMAPGQAYGQAAGYLGQGGQAALGYGQAVEGYQQRALQDAMSRFNYQYQEPWQRAAQMGQVMGLLQPIGMQNTSGIGQGQTQTPNPNYQSLASGMLQGALGGGMMGYGMYQQNQQNQPMGLNYGAHATSLGNTVYPF